MKIYSGAFRRWRGDWLPLIYTEDESYPIMLAKTEGLGLWVVTTMFLASSNIKVLIDNLIFDAKRNILAIQQYHARHRTLRLVRAARAAGILVAVGIAAYLVLASRLITTDLPYTNSLAGNLGLSVLLTVALWFANKLRAYVWSSVRSALNR